MSKAISALKEELVGVRAGRANPAILDKITVDYYGVPTPINQLASISVPEARVIVIQPWEARLLKDIEKAIQKSDIGINPSNDGKVIRLVFPVPTEERRKELTRQVKKFGENAKIAVRNVRRDAIEEFKTQKKNSEITEDDLKVAENDVQKLTDKYIAEIDKVVELKEKEIMEV
jgi:ribosome recycling factor